MSPTIVAKEVRPVAPTEKSVVSRPSAAARAGSPFWTIAWFGLLAGWLELAVVLLRGVVGAPVTWDMMRRNRHYLWMIPVADLVVFAGVCLVIAPLARYGPRFARWLAIRLGIGLTSLAVLLNIEVLHPAASALLACGLAAEGGRWLGRRAEGLGRLMRLSAPVLAGGLVVLAPLGYHRVATAELRARALTPPAKPGKPNVLFIVLDDVRAASLGLYGCGRDNTPNLERWAQRGIVYARARATAPWTLPSHASMFTGRWPHELSVAWEKPLDRTYPTLAETLRGEGYATAGFVGNLYFCSSLFGLARGFDRYEAAYENLRVSPFEVIRSASLVRWTIKGLGLPIRGNEWDTAQRKSAEMLNRDVLTWLSTRPAGRPFFTFINYYDAHAPWLPPDGLEPHYGMANLPLADRLAIDRRFVDWQQGKPLPAGYTAERIQAEALPVYRDSYESCIAYLDHQLGILLDELERQGLMENTLVVITSDHGEEFGGHGIVGHCLSLYSHEIHVPLLIIPPGRSSASSTMQVVHNAVSIREIPATIAASVGLAGRNPFPTGSLLRFLEDGPEPAQTTPVLSEVQQMKHIPRTERLPSSLGPVESVLLGDRVYIRRADGHEELYDLTHDPFEFSDLAGFPESRQALSRFREELDRLCGREPSPSPGRPE
jgi:arylsulfatase A-like enzyme